MSIFEQAKELRTALAVRETFDHLPKEAVDELVAATACYRHARRVDATLDAALTGIMGWVDGTVVRTMALVRIFFDLHGVGGFRGLGGGRSARNELFAHLGTGRWQARDGGAWRGAAESAVGPLTVNIDGEGVRFCSDGDAVTIQLRHFMTVVGGDGVAETGFLAGFKEEVESWARDQLNDQLRSESPSGEAIRTLSALIAMVREAGAKEVEALAAAPSTTDEDIFLLEEEIEI